ncbi:MAG: M60 family metallopeptidase, partial [Alistipes sp.]|nr:M60 family metallopeptidase [Alistipes sp.]
GGSGDFSIRNDKVKYVFREDEDIVFIPVKSNIPEREWEISEPTGDWCHVARSYDNEKGLYLAVDQNEELDIRTAEFTAGAGNKIYTINVRQLGTSPAILVSNRLVDSRGGEFEIEVVSNIPIRMNKPKLNEAEAEGDDEPWLTTNNNGEPVEQSTAESKYSFYALANDKPYTRSATVEFTADNLLYQNVTKTCTITQSTNSISTSSSMSDKMATIVSGSVDNNEFQGGSPISNLYDGRVDRDDDAYIYHSRWGGATWPITMHFTLLPTRVSYFKYYSRFSDSSNGNPGALDVWYRQSGSQEFIPVMEGEFGSADNSMYDFEKKSGTHRASFPETFENVEEIKITFYNGNNNHLSGVEIEFYEDMSPAVNESLLEVFTDLSCTELKEGITRQDITELYKTSGYLAQEVAMRLFNGTYPDNEREFRIGNYEAYSDVEVMYLKYRTRRYSQHDNPTGIYAVPGQKLLVCVDHIPAGHKVSLGIAGENGDGYSARFNGFDTKVELMPGLNEITPASAGMCYVINTASNLTSSSESVKVHILPGCGTVEGYFDMRYHTDEDYVRLINNTTAKYFVAKGKNMIFNMHTSVLRQYAPTGILSGLSSWDNILGWQFELMGIGRQVDDNGTWDSWDRMVDETGFNNHMMAISNNNPTSYMDASDYRINFNSSSAIPKIISREQLLKAEDNTWGPAHEAGHVNQRAILWKSNAESSNNLFSNFAIYKFGKYGSRGSALSEIAGCFADGQSWVEMGDATHMNESTEIHMRMNWQLWNYFHRCGFDPQFWPRLFYLLRTKYILPNEMASAYGLTENNGLCQMMFAEAVCEAAQMDFTDFFEVWGFLRPVDITYEQYGKARYNVTEAMVADLREKMSKYSEKAPAIQYIEDRDRKNGVLYSELGYYTTYQNRLTVSGTPSYTLNNRTLNVSGAANGVAIEVRGPEGSDGSLGELRYFSNMTNFTIPSGVSMGGMTVYVVQWDSKRIKATQK